MEKKSITGGCCFRIHIPDQPGMVAESPYKKKQKCIGFHFDCFTTLKFGKACADSGNFCIGGKVQMSIIFPQMALTAGCLCAISFDFVLVHSNISMIVPFSDSTM